MQNEKRNTYHSHVPQIFVLEPKHTKRIFKYPSKQTVNGQITQKDGQNIKNKYLMYNSYHLKSVFITRFCQKRSIEFINARLCITNKNSWALLLGFQVSVPIFIRVVVSEQAIQNLDLNSFDPLVSACCLF